MLRPLSILACWVCISFASARLAAKARPLHPAASWAPSPSSWSRKSLAWLSTAAKDSRRRRRPTWKWVLGKGVCQPCQLLLRPVLELELASYLLPPTFSSGSPCRSCLPTLTSIPAIASFHVLFKKTCVRYGLVWYWTGNRFDIILSKKFVACLLSSFHWLHHLEKHCHRVLWESWKCVQF